MTDPSPAPGAPAPRRAAPRDGRARALAASAPPDRLLSSTETAHLLGLSRTGVWEIARRDPTFPRPKHLGERIRRWSLAELSAWVEARTAQREPGRARSRAVVAVGGASADA